MKRFYPTYLYIKTHNKTGLKYFGKTTNDPKSYYGSGKYWLAHLKTHGYDVSTEIIGFFKDKDLCENAAMSFSKNNDIVKSNDWANLINENGLDGGNTGRTNYGPMPERTKCKLRKKLKGRTPWNKGVKGKSQGNTTPRSKETKEKLRKINLGKRRSAESVKKTADALRGRKRPEAALWLTGRTVSEETKKKISKSNTGKTVSIETKNKIKKARATQIFTNETKDKLKGKIVVINKEGTILKIDKDHYYSQPNIGDNREYVFHNCYEGKRRKSLK